jgi:hypothetical protein
MYGEPTIEFFSVRGGIAMAAEYGPDRAACELLIGHTQSLIQRETQNPISSPAVSDLLREWVPLATRGKEINTTTVQIGGTVLLKTDYENVSIRRECFSQSCLSSKDSQDLSTLLVFRRETCPKRIE